MPNDLLSGLVRLHILHHAAKEPLFGSWVIEELRKHGYRLSPGTLYPLLHALEQQGYLKSKSVRAGRVYRKMYRITPTGRRAFLDAKVKVRELFGELFED
jgi:DNA-binding PadR family transcriptional regulator